MGLGSISLSIHCNKMIFLFQSDASLASIFSHCFISIAFYLPYILLICWGKPHIAVIHDFVPNYLKIKLLAGKEQVCNFELPTFRKLFASLSVV